MVYEDKAHVHTGNGTLALIIPMRRANYNDGSVPIQDSWIVLAYPELILERLRCCIVAAEHTFVTLSAAAAVLGVFTLLPPSGDSLSQSGDRNRD